jgi:hypothetical protein
MLPIDGGLDSQAILLEREFVGHDDVIGKKSRRKNIEGPVDGVAVDTAGEPRCRAGIHRVIDRADQRRFFVPDGRQVNLAHAGRPEEKDGTSMGDRTQGLGDRWRSADGLDHEGKTTHEHDVGFASDDPRTDDVRQFLEMGVAGVAPHHVVGTAGRRRHGLMGMAGDHGDRTPGKESLHGGHNGEPDDPGTDDEYRITVGGRRPQKPMAGDRYRFVQAGAAIRHRVGERVHH